jgi:TonB family protein
MFKPKNNLLARIAIVIFIDCSLVYLSGCSVFMAARQPDYKNLNVLDIGTSRSRVIGELGAPALTQEREGNKVDTFSFKQGYGKGNKAARALFHAAADVWTLGLWEVIGTPAEAIASGKKMQVEVTYNQNDEVEGVKFIDTTPKKEPKKASPKKQPVMEGTNILITSYSEYYRLLYKTISQKIVKPPASGSGVVNAAFTLRSDGTLEGVRILDSSTGDYGLRDAVRRAIGDSAPFPEFPEDIKAEGRKEFSITIEFRGG